MLTIKPTLFWIAAKEQVVQSSRATERQGVAVRQRQAENAGARAHDEPESVTRRPLPARLDGLRLGR